MSQITEPTPAKLFVSLMFGGTNEPQDTPAVSEALAALKHEFGPVDVLSPVLAFNFTAYYREEMGEPLWRRVLSFERLVSRGQLADIKLFAAELEKRFVDGLGHRRANIDPGLLSPENLVLATGKNMTHRVYLQRGVFADLALLYRNRSFQPLPWTYPDYIAPEMTTQLTLMRDKLLDQLRRGTTPPQRHEPA
jgi:hypothetical protein